MAEVVVAVGGFLVPSIQHLIALGRIIARNYARGGLPAQQMVELHERLEVIRSMVDGASANGFINDAPAISHLWRLKDAIHDTTEILNMLHQERNQRQGLVQRALRFGRRWIFGGSDGNSSSSSNNNNNNNYSSRMNELVGLIERLRTNCEGLKDLIQFSPRAASGISRPSTGPVSTRGNLFGYDKEYAYLLRKIRYEDAEVVAIVGHAGMGKTELARKAFNNQTIYRAWFDLRIWVCVYHKFTETDLLKEIWKSAFGSDPCGEMNVACLQKELIKKVESAFRRRRYLLVLDDVCHDESEANDQSWRTWKSVLDLFKQHGKQGSRIIVTTRAQICAATLGADACIQLNGIDKDEMKLLIKETAFGDKNAQVPQVLNMLDRDVGQLHGSPLAAEKVGTMLKDNYDSRQWEEVLKEDLHDSVHKNHISSYLDLPPPLQRCFAFCSIFPKKWEFELEKLIMMWMALDFVESPPGSNSDGMTRENMARSYFDALLQRSFFQEAGRINDNLEASYYVIHEHIHSMIRRVCPAYFQSIDGNTDQNDSVTPTVAHLSVTTHH